MGVDVRTLLVDNFDSYTFNLFQLVAEITGREPLVIRNDHRDLPLLSELGVESVVISPGPGHPGISRDFGLCTELLHAAELPVLGVCLGHQGIGHLYGGRIVPAPEVMHGRRSQIGHVGRGLFEGIPQDFKAVRYHSLIVEEDGSRELERLAWTSDGLCMGVRHRHKPLWGVQFHPESILTEYGHRLVANFVELARQTRSTARFRPAPPASDKPSFAPLQSPHAQQPLVAMPETTVREQRELPVWIDPAQVFVDFFGTHQDSFWLDSARWEDGCARYSFMGTFPGGPLSERISYRVGGELSITTPDQEQQQVNADLFEYLDRRLVERGSEPTDLPFAGGWVGYLGYELKADCGGCVSHSSALPDAQLMFADRYLAFDHLERRTYAVALRMSDNSSNEWFDEVTGRLLALAQKDRRSDDRIAYEGFRNDNGRFSKVHFELSRDHEHYLRDIAECKRLLREGETYEVCLTNTLVCAPLDDPLGTYLELRRLNPAPYAAWLCFHSTWTLGSSPERFLHIGADRWIEAKPIKGTAARAEDPAADRRASDELRASEKNQAENLMIVDLLRNDLGRVCEVGSVHVPALMAIETYATVHQMVSTVRGKLREHLRPVDCVRAAFPGGSMTGAPKLRTMEIIDRIEDRARGVYSGSIGYLGVDGAVDLNIVIRTIVQTPEECSIGAGGAIVYGSDPNEEFSEMLLKATPLLKAITNTTRSSDRPTSIIEGGRRLAARPV